MDIVADWLIKKRCVFRLINFPVQSSKMGAVMLGSLEKEDVEAFLIDFEVSFVFHYCILLID